MSKKAVSIIAVILVVLVGLAVFAVAQQRTKSTPGLLQGQSENWQVTAKFTPSGGETVIAPVLDYFQDFKVESATVTFVYKDQSTTPIPVINPDAIARRNGYKVQEMNTSKTWQDVDHVEIEWQTGGRKFKEYINVVNKLPAK